MPERLPDEAPGVGDGGSPCGVGAGRRATPVGASRRRALDAAALLARDWNRAGRRRKGISAVPVVLAGPAAEAWSQRAERGQDRQRTAAGQGLAVHCATYRR